MKKLNSLPLLDESVAGNTVFEWLSALAVALAVFLVMRLSVTLLRGRLQRFAKRTRTSLDDVLVQTLGSTKNTFLLLISAFVGSLTLQMKPTTTEMLRAALIVVVIIQATIWANRAVASWMENERSARSESDPGTVTTLQGISYVVRVLIWSGGLLLVLDNLGVDVTALVAGLGIGGIAGALALQNVLGDLLAALSITLDKPFINGDFVIVGDYLGTVEHIGLKTTRIRSLSGEQLIFSNSDLLSSRIRNYKRMQERRIVFSFGVTYQTSPETLRVIPDMVREIISDLERTRFDRAHFKEFGDSAYLFEVVYYVLEPDYNLYMDIQQQINLAICERFAERGIEIAYPTRTLYFGAPVDLHVGRDDVRASQTRS
ncbi:MAG: mechanosensitive ion channel family protein [Deltaproteobacteria bacterium]|nr:mechanosensitive ion channel family protein [Deltaproteobacteria bacterium]